MKILMYFRVLMLLMVFVSAQQGFAASNFTIEPLGDLPTLVRAGGSKIIPFVVTNLTQSTRSHYTLNRLPSNVKQLYSSASYADAICGSSFDLAANGRCLLLLEVTGSAVFHPSICNGTSCTSASVSVNLQAMSNDTSFPFGTAPTSTTALNPYGASTMYSGAPDTYCAGYFTTPESLLGSWAMKQALEMDIALDEQAFPKGFTVDNTVYAVGTAAVGSSSIYNIDSCDGGCSALNGQCFAIQFNEKSSDDYQYMIFQSVNVGAATDTFDIYLPGGGSGCFQPEYCQTFWGTGGAVDFSKSITETTTPGDCSEYFGDYSSINTSYSVTYPGSGCENDTCDGKTTLKNACSFAQSSGFNAENFTDVTILPITCPIYLTQVTGVSLDDQTQLAVGQSAGGTTKTVPLSELGLDDSGNIINAGATTDTNPYALNISKTGNSWVTTQMQDCKTPDAGFSGHLSSDQVTSVAYQVAFSASLDACQSSGTAPYLIMPGNNPDTCSQNTTAATSNCQIPNACS